MIDQVKVFLGLGSNLDGPEFQIKQALIHLSEHTAIQLIQVSSFYHSKPMGPQDQPDFVNAVCEIRTDLGPYQLMAVTQGIEYKQHRVKTRHWGERTIDIDILLYGALKLNSPELTIPHPGMLDREFVMQPLLEIVDEEIIRKLMAA